MRKLGVTLLFAAMSALPYAAHSQEGAAPTADDFVCALSDDCPEAESEEPVDSSAQPSGRPRISATRGFSLSRPTEPAPTTTRPAQTRNQRPNATRPNQRQVASRPNQRQVAAPQQRRVDLRLSFGPGSSILSDAAQAQVRAVAEALKRPQLANVRVRIEGHTDSSGGRAVNLALSQRRAQAVADFLMSQGIAQNRLEVRGYGFDQPLAGYPASASQNRRVEAARIS